MILASGQSVSFDCRQVKTRPHTALSQTTQIQLRKDSDIYNMSFLNKFRKDFEGLNLGERLGQQQAGKFWYICFVSLLT
jgi:hypothetical protein